ncbi:hypothetical protein [Delftia sp. PS-11]|uniref:hypothetical protein n=1 Tax=Delftia sp. PS-11 TaxID=2767222 RepID=UPI003AB27C5F
MTAITTAVRLLREAATELKKSHTLNGDWGNEHDALTAYNAHIAAAADLERIAPQCLAQIQEPAQPTSIVLDDRWKARILDGRALERDDMGLGDHPELPQLDEGMKPRGFFAALGLELSHTFAEDQLDGDALEAMGDAVNWTAWQPTPPQGDGWKLVAIFDTEDGPAAWWLRELAEAEDGTTTIRNLQAEIEKLKARMARVSRASAAPAAVAGPADMRNALRWAAGGLRAVADDNDTLRIGSETRTVGEVLDAANAALEPAAPALEAPAAPAAPNGWKLVPVNPTIAMLLAGDHARISTEHQTKPQAAYAAMLAAAPQAPAAPLGPAWRSIADGIPQWTDDNSVRVIAVTAHDCFNGVRVHDIRASDFHDAEGDDVARVCTHWAYRDDIWPRAGLAAPAAPAVDALAPVQALLDMHAALLDANPYAYFELSYTRQTGWMAWLTDKPFHGPVINPDRQVLARGQGDTPAEACAAAARAKEGGAA